jgi:hypothetical protein
VEELKYLTILTDLNFLQEQIMRNLILVNVWYQSVQKLLFSRSHSNHLKIKIYVILILPVILNGCETWSLTPREIRSRKVLKNKVLKDIFGTKRDEVTVEWGNVNNVELYDFNSLSNNLLMVKPRRMIWARHLARMGKIEFCTGCWWESFSIAGHWGNQDIDGIIKI